jgi:acylphosphatase
MTKTRAHLHVSGKVQGVYFRQHTRRQAQIRDVSGWVRNLDDGRVEAAFEGDEEAVKDLVDYCRHGPSSAQVTGFEVAWAPFRGEFSSFNIVY